MAITTIGAATAATLFSRASDQLTRWDIAVTPEEVAMANILEFDPEAQPPIPASATPESDDANHYLAVPGITFSAFTWARLAMAAYGGSPTQALAYFISQRGRERS